MKGRADAQLRARSGLHVPTSRTRPRTTRASRFASGSIPAREIGSPPNRRPPAARRTRRTAARARRLVRARRQQRHGHARSLRRRSRQNRPPTVRAACDPCTVEVGRTSTISADAQDPDGDPLTYQWTTPGRNGRAARPPGSRRGRRPGSPVRCRSRSRVDDGRGGTASDGVTIQVVQPRAVHLRRRPLRVRPLHAAARCA